MVTNEVKKRRSPGGGGEALQTSPGYLDPSKEKVDRVHVIVLSLPEGQELKVCIRVWLLQKLSHQSVHFQGSEYVKTHSHDGELPEESWGVSEKSRGS